MDTQYQPALIESRQVYGITLEQRRNDAKISKDTFTNIVSKNKDVRQHSSPIPRAAALTLQLQTALRLGHHRSDRRHHRA